MALTSLLARSRLSRVGIAGRDAIIAALTVLLISLSTGYLVHRSATQALEHEVKSNLLSLAGSAAMLTDGDALLQIDTPEDKGTAAYERVTAPYRSLLGANPNIASIYTVRQVGAQTVFTTDSAIIQPGATDDTSAVMAEYVDASDTLHQALDGQRAIVEADSYTDEWGTFLSAYAPLYSSSGEFIGIVGADISLTDYQARLDTIRQSLYIGLTIAFIAALICGAGVWYVRNTAVKAEARRETEQARFAALELERQEQQRLQQEAAELYRRDEMHKMADSLDLSVQGVVLEVGASVQRMQADALGVTRIADDTLQRSGHVAQVANDTASLSAQVSAAAEELTATIHEIGAQTLRSRDVAGEAVRRADLARAAIDTLSAQSVTVGDIVTVINGVAAQLTMLALNATIEAARAGEAGRGFAVVSVEVKKLANQVHQATGQIAHQIEAMQGATRRSVQDVIAVSDTIEDVAGSIQAMAVSVEEQSGVTNEIARIIALSAAGADDICATIATVQDGAEQTGRSADEVLQATDQLGRQSDILKQKVDEFLLAVRAT